MREVARMMSPSMHDRGGERGSCLHLLHASLCINGLLGPLVLLLLPPCLLFFVDDALGVYGLGAVDPVEYALLLLHLGRAPRALGDLQHVTHTKISACPTTFAPYKTPKEESQISHLVGWLGVRDVIAGEVLDCTASLLSALLEVLLREGSQRMSA